MGLQKLSCLSFSKKISSTDLGELDMFDFDVILVWTNSVLVIPQSTVEPESLNFSFQMNQSLNVRVVPQHI